MVILCDNPLDVQELGSGKITASRQENRVELDCEFLALTLRKIALGEKA